MKICITCKLEKSLNDFNKSRAAKDGYRPTCKECRYGHKPHTIVKDNKTCTGCNNIKTIENFRFTNQHYRSSYCKPCDNKRRENYRRLHPEKEYRRGKNKRLKRLYKIDLKEYDELVIKQKNKCSICPNEGNLVVDHSHITGKIRGLLCSTCNVGLGMFKENIELLEASIRYLKIN